MRVIGNAVGMIFRRPFIVLFLGAIILAGSVINHFNPLFTLLFGLSTLGGGNVIDSLLSMLQLAMNLMSGTGALWMVIGLLCTIAFISIAAGLLFSGYFYIINSVVEKKPKSGGEFSSGTRKYFIKITWTTLKILFLGSLFVVFAVVASVPAITMTKLALSSKPEAIVMVVLFDILTFIVIFFAFMFFRIYSLFCFPAVINEGKKPFVWGKRVVDGHFWNIAGVFFTFDIVFILFQSMIMYFNHSAGLQEAANQPLAVGVFIGNWVFKTLFFSMLIAYIFSAFKAYREER